MTSNGRDMCRDTSKRRHFSRSAGLGILILCATGATEAAESGPYLGADLGWAFTSGNVAWRTAPSIALEGPGLSDQDVAWSFQQGTVSIASSVWKRDTWTWAIFRPRSRAGRIRPMRMRI